MWRLIVPFDYLFRVRHSEKRFFDVFLPAILTAITIGAVYLLDLKVVAFGDAGLITNLQSLTSILTGFFIAALAAVATFPSPDMDKIMPGKDPMLLKRKVKGHEQSEPLTRRRFLSLMFGYTASLSFLLFLSGAIGKVIGPQLMALVPNPAQAAFRTVLLGLYVFAFWNLIITTFLGLFYLSDRIHRGNTGIRRNPHSNSGAENPAE